MNPISISFEKPLPDEAVTLLRDRVQDLDSHLQSRLVDELVTEAVVNQGLARAYAYRRSEAGHLRWEVQKVDGNGLELIAAPFQRLGGAFDHSLELCRIWLQQTVAAWIQEQVKANPGRIEVRIADWEAQGLNVRSDEVVSATSQGRVLQISSWVTSIALLLVVGVVAFTLFRMYRLVDEVRSSYIEIQETVDERTQEILESVEKGISTSDRVINMMDKVRGMVVPEDSTP